MNDPLALFHPLIAGWFRDRVGTPTAVQAEAWPVIAGGGHVLVTAPTGSGKTLTAFLWAIDRLVTGAWPGGRTRVLYVSPLKALNTDIRRNLLQPLAGLAEAFRAAGVPFPELRAETRSGDTPQSERRRMLRRPPEILITTPESLNLLISSASGRSVLDSLATVIIDEIHTVVGSKRGVHLITAVDRLVALSGEFQRLAVSATVRPPELVAEYVGGFRLEPGPGGPRYFPRPVAIVRSGRTKTYDLRVARPDDEEVRAVDDPFWPPYIREFREIIARNRSSLFFTRSRRMSEHLAVRINAGADKPVAYAHHGSLAKELRLEVETKLKAGALRAIVATSSLELGIDIGALDEVILVQAPPSVSSAIQRVGRAGHRVGAVSRGTFVPTQDQDIVESAVAARATMDGNIESVRPVENPLDVLAQVLLSMVGTGVWTAGDLYDRIRTSWPYRRLGRETFDLVLRMMAGRYAHTRLRELRPSVSFDRVDDTVTARPGALLSLFVSGGTIPDRGYYHLRHEDTGSLIGELDEEFVWEASPGQAFAFGTQNWVIRRITHNEVFVRPAGPKAADAPFWKAEAFNRDAHFSDLIAAFMEEADARLEDPVWQAALRSDFALEDSAAERLIDYLRRQKQETGGALPHARHVVSEHVRSGPGGYPGSQIVLHTLWGGQVNRPFALALDAAWEERFGHRLEIYPGDDSIMLQLPHPVPAAELLSMVNEGNLEGLLRKRLESSGYFLARFRENAGRALLLTRRRLNERLPLWMSRLQAQKLLQAVLPMEDFPILLETWRTCLRDEFDLDALKRKIGDVARGAVRISDCTTSKPSPLAARLTWSQVNNYMYSAYELPADRRSRLKGGLLREFVFSPGLRPAVSAETVRRFEAKRQRLSPGYAPSPGRDLVDWVKERMILPEREWAALLKAIDRDHGEAAGSENDQDKTGIEIPAGEEIVPRTSGGAVPGGAIPLRLPPETAARLVRLRPGGSDRFLVSALERLPEILAAFPWVPETGIEALGGGPPEAATAGPFLRPMSIAAEERDGLFTSLLGEWLQAYGPLVPGEIAARLALDAAGLDLALEDMRDSEALIAGPLIRDAAAESVCDADNYEILLRLERASLAPRVEPRPIADLPLFLASIQGLTGGPRGRAGTPEESLGRAIEQLVGYPLPAALWEADILPARIRGYSAAMLDFALSRSDLRWQGLPGRQVRFLFEQDIDLLAAENGETEDTDRNDDAVRPSSLPGSARTPPEPAGLFPDPDARFDFGSLLKRSGGDLAALESRLWDEVWSGRLTNDTFSALRRGLQTRFRVGDVIARQKRGLEFAPRRGRLHMSAWGEKQAYPGSWLLLPSAAGASGDLIEREERRKDRVRLLLDRYGILFRELLLREPPPFRWSDLFRTLRLMELSGEVLAGYFFDGVPGPQFMSPAAFQAFRHGLPEDAVFWVGAVDPASACGLPLEGLRGVFPKRVEGAHVVFHGSRPVLTSQRKGGALTILAPPDEPRMPEYLEVFRHLLTRDFDPVKRIVMETINDEPAVASPYLPAFKALFETVVDRGRVSLFRRLER